MYVKTTDVSSAVYIHDLFPDPRVGDWLLMSSPYPTFVLTALYLLIVYFGPKVMEKREPFSLKNFIIVYNFFLVLLSAYMLYEVCLRKAFIILPL